MTTVYSQERKSTPDEGEEGNDDTVMHSGADELEVQRRDNVPSMHLKHSSDRRRSHILGRNSGGVHRQVQKIFQSE